MKEYTIDVNTRFFVNANTYDEALEKLNKDLNSIKADSYRETTGVSECLVDEANEKPMTDTDKGILRQKLADRLFNYIDPWDREYESADDIANDIKNDPELVIEYLMDLLEEV